MRSIIFFVSLLVGLTVTAINGFQIPTSQYHVSRQRQSSKLFGGSSGRASTLEGKKEAVSKVKELLDDSQMIFTVPASSITVAESQSLRRSMPEGTTISVVKNTLMRRAVEGTEFELATSMLKGSNMWFFCGDDMGASIKAFNSFAKEADKKESHGILGGIMEGTEYDSKGVEAIGNLPSKKELYATIARSINAVPTKVARVIKEPTSKLGRAIRLATVDEDSSE